MFITNTLYWHLTFHSLLSMRTWYLKVTAAWSVKAIKPHSPHITLNWTSVQYVSNFTTKTLLFNFRDTWLIKVTKVKLQRTCSWYGNYLIRQDFFCITSTLTQNNGHRKLHVALLGHPVCNHSIMSSTFHGRQLFCGTLPQQHLQVRVQHMMTTVSRGNNGLCLQSITIQYSSSAYHDKLTMCMPPYKKHNKIETFTFPLYLTTGLSVNTTKCAEYVLDKLFCCS